MTTNQSISQESSIQSNTLSQETPPHKKSSVNLLAILFALLALGATGAAAYFGYENYQLKQQVVEVQEIQEISDSTTTALPSPFPSPTNDPFADWETYNFSPIGSDGSNSFQIKFPKHLQVAENPIDAGFYISSAETVSESDVNTINGNYKLNFSLSTLQTGQSLSDIVDEILEYTKVNSIISTPKQIYKIAEFNAYEYGYKTAEDLHFYVIQQNVNSDWYILVKLSGDLNFKLTDQILSTIEFTDQTSASSIDTFEWETFSHNTHGYSFKYPPELALNQAGKTVILTANSSSETNSQQAIRDAFMSSIIELKIFDFDSNQQTVQDWMQTIPIFENSVDNFEEIQLTLKQHIKNKV